MKLINVTKVSIIGPPMIPASLNVFGIDKYDKPKNIFIETTKHYKLVAFLFSCFISSMLIVLWIVP